MTASPEGTKQLTIELKEAVDPPTIICRRHNCEHNSSNQHCKRPTNLHNDPNFSYETCPFFKLYKGKECGIR